VSAHLVPCLSREYLSALTGEDDPVVTFQTFSDVKPPSFTGRSISTRPSWRG
jgi:hypothetical protein